MAYQMYVSLQNDNRIARFVMDPKTGKLESQGVVDIEGRPSPLAINPTGTTLHVGQRNGLRLSSSAIDQQNGDLTLPGSVVPGEEPCYLSTDHTSRQVLSSYYQAGRCAVHPIDETGAIGGAAPEWLETNSGAHCFQTDPTNRYAFLTHIDTGSDGLALLPTGRQVAVNAIYQLKFNPDTGRLTPNAPLVVHAEAEDAPRQYRFHPSKDLVFLQRAARQRNRVCTRQIVGNAPGWPKSDQFAQ